MSEEFDFEAFIEEAPKEEEPKPIEEITTVEIDLEPEPVSFDEPTEVTFDEPELDIHEEPEEVGFTIEEPKGTNVLALKETKTTLAAPLTDNFLPSEDIILAQIKRLEFLKKNLVDKSDYAMYKFKNPETKQWERKPAMKKSGFRKLIIGFGISINLIEKRYFQEDGDTHAEAIVKATLPNGQSMDGIALKSASEYGGRRWTRHDLEATAYTKAVNRAVGDLVGIGEVSYEELEKGG
jgi:hypothetical protein